MSRLFARFFTSDNAFRAFFMLTIVTLIFGVFCTFFNEIYFDTLIRLFLAAGFIVLYQSYLNHDKNVMKGMIGTVMGIIVTYDAYRLFAPETEKWMPLTVLHTAVLVLDVAFTVVHYRINSDHHSSPRHVFFNQLLLVLLALASVVTELLSFRLESSLVWYVTCVVLALSYVFAFGAIACIESKLDAYRIRREQNGWTPDQSR